jgi:hypothetical protein
LSKISDERDLAPRRNVSYETITKNTQDDAFVQRVTAAIAKEAWANEAYGATEFGKTVKTSGPFGAVNYFLWPLAVDNETAYEYALNLDPPNPNPGSDPGVISDGAIQSGIQTHWPEPIVEPAQAQTLPA